MAKLIYKELIKILKSNSKLIDREIIFNKKIYDRFFVYMYHENKSTGIVMLKRFYFYGRLEISDLWRHRLIKKDRIRKKTFELLKTEFEKQF